MAEKLYQDRDWLYQKYVTEKLTTSQIADLVGIKCNETIRGWLIRFSIPRRNMSTTEGREHLTEIRKKAAKAHGEAVRQAWANGSYNNVFTTLEYRAKKAEEARQRWESGAYGAEYARKQSETKIAAWARGAYDGVHQTSAIREKFSLGIRAAWQRGAYSSSETHQKRVNSARARPKFSRKTRSLMSIARRQAWASGVYDHKRLRRVGASSSSIELSIQKALDSLGVKYEFQFRPKDYSRVYDFLIYPNTVLEVHGDYWHTLPGVEERDREKLQWAVENGYCYHVLWEHEIGSLGVEGLKARLGGLFG